MSFGERFLSEPDLAPQRAAGEPCGGATIVIDFVGGPYGFRGLSRSQLATLRGRFGDLLRGFAGEVAVWCDLFRLPGDDFRPIELRDFVYALDFEHRADRVRLAGLSLVALIEWAASGAPRGALFTCETAGASFLGAFENFFRVVTAYRLLQRGGVLLHSAGVAQDGEARIFLGYSGAGKTTLSRRALADGLLVLSDDINAVLPGARGIEVERVPFAGELQAELHPPDDPRQRYRLAGLYRLEKNLVAGQTHGMDALSAAAAVSLLLRCAPFVNADPHRAAELLAVLERIAAAVPGRIFRFALGGGAWWPRLQASETAAIAEEGG